MQAQVHPSTLSPAATLGRCAPYISQFPFQPPSTDGALRPSEEYRTPTDEEWEEFLGHFQRRRVALGDCGRAYGTGCVHEHSCVRCPLLRVDPAQRPRLVDIRDNLIARIDEAQREGWAGEAEGLKVSLTAANAKLAQLDGLIARRNTAVSLGMPTFPDIAGRTATPPRIPHDPPATLATALRTQAQGVYCLGAAAELLIAQSWPHRADFTGAFLTIGRGLVDGRAMATIDWAAAITALEAGRLPSSAGEQRMLRITASLAGGIPVDLRDALTGIDDNNIQLLVTAVLHALGRRPPPETP